MRDMCMQDNQHLNSGIILNRVISAMLNMCDGHAPKHKTAPTLDTLAKGNRGH